MCPATWDVRVPELAHVLRDDVPHEREAFVADAGARALDHSRAIASDRPSAEPADIVSRGLRSCEYPPDLDDQRFVDARQSTNRIRENRIGLRTRVVIQRGERVLRAAVANVDRGSRDELLHFALRSLTERTREPAPDRERRDAPAADLDFAKHSRRAIRVGSAENFGEPLVHFFFFAVAAAALFGAGVAFAVAAGFATEVFGGGVAEMSVTFAISRRIVFRSSDSVTIPVK